ncbi:hypothetical protein CJU54_00570 [Pseudomonas aeruginosa]|nr:hypothetical protein CJU56_00570 [Pseudomonas aeruginosa]PBZ60710.1 hypothetical protein CJU55_03740 [Pseudomonas aeruginosa]PBZ67629.1 hypothetical protein CJU54_00570 [Pseudomonas aeruginosa]
MSIDYLEEVSRRSGCRFVYTDVPRARAWLMFARGEADVVLGAVRSARRDEAGSFYSQHIEEGVSLVSLKAQPLHLKSREAILASGLAFSFVRGHYYGPRTAELMSALTARGSVALVKDPKAMLRMLKAGRVDGAIVLSSSITTDAHGLGLDQMLTATVVEDLDWTTAGLYMSKHLPPEDQLLLSHVFTELNAEDFYIQLAEGLLKAQPAWVQTSIRLQRQFPFHLVEQISPSPIIRWPHEPTR